MIDQREAIYADALDAAFVKRNGAEFSAPDEWGDEARAVMAVADAEQAELRAKVERLSLNVDVNRAKWKAAEAKVARVEALVSNWESVKSSPENEAWTHYVAERVRNALSGDYSSEAQVP